MRKVLIISYLFTHDTAIGAIRMRGLAKYLPENGWECTVLTVDSGLGGSPFKDVIATSEKDRITAWKIRLGFNLNKPVREQFGLKIYKEKNIVVNFLVNMIKEVFAYPDIHNGWFEYAMIEGIALMETRKFDAIISSSGPETAHIIAHELKQRNATFWVADYRDLWTQNHYYSYSPIRKFFEKRLEKKTISTADALVTVSAHMTQELISLHKGKVAYFIPNGFDNDSVNPGSPLSPNFTITYTGQLLRGRRDPEPLFWAIHELVREGCIDLRDITVHFYGWCENWLEDDIKKYALEDVVKIHGLVAREEAIRFQRQSQLLLLLSWNTPEERGVYTGKIFEYLAAKRPIFSIGTSGGVIGELLEHTQTGVHLYNKEKVKEALKKFYEEYKLHWNG